MLAISEGHSAIVKALLQAGADVDKAANDGYTALMEASQEGHSDIVDLLLQAGAALAQVPEDPEEGFGLLLSELHVVLKSAISLSSKGEKSAPRAKGLKDMYLMALTSKDASPANIFHRLQKDYEALPAAGA